MNLREKGEGYRAGETLNPEEGQDWHKLLENGTEGKKVILPNDTQTR